MYRIRSTPPARTRERRWGLPLALPAVVLPLLAPACSLPAEAVQAADLCGRQLRSLQNASRGLRRDLEGYHEELRRLLSRAHARERVSRTIERFADPPAGAESGVERGAVARDFIESSVEIAEEFHRARAEFDRWLARPGRKLEEKRAALAAEIAALDGRIASARERGPHPSDPELELLLRAREALAAEARAGDGELVYVRIALELEEAGRSLGDSLALARAELDLLARLHDRVDAYVFAETSISGRELARAALAGDRTGAALERAFGERRSRR